MNKKLEVMKQFLDETDRAQRRSFFGLGNIKAFFIDSKIRVRLMKETLDLYEGLTLKELEHQTKICQESKSLKEYLKLMEFTSCDFKKYLAKKKLKKKVDWKKVNDYIPMILMIIAAICLLVQFILLGRMVQIGVDLRIAEVEFLMAIAGV